MFESLSAIHQLVHKRVGEVFGPPDNTTGRDDHWGIRPYPMAAAINVLVNSARTKPAVWVFDPYSGDDGVIREQIDDEAHLERVIEQIRQRVKSAAARHPSAPP